MPIEIKELVIRATVRDQEGSKPAPADMTKKEQLVKECVEQVMDILKRQKER